MAKKRSCRRTQDEAAIHEEAVRLRKMTDQQLVDEFRRAKESAEVCAERPVASAVSFDEEKAEENRGGVRKLLDELAEGKCKGIKGATVYKITEFASGLGLI